MSSPREPIASPPGRATLARPTSGDERAQHGDRCPEAAYELVGGLVVELLGHLDRGAAGRRLAGRVGVAGVGDLDGAAELAQQLAHHGDVEDVRARCGSPTGPGASSAAAISFSAEFLAPPTWTVPDSGRVSGPSETTRKLPTAVTLVTRGRGPSQARRTALGWLHGQPDAHLHAHRRRRARPASAT